MNIRSQQHISFEAPHQKPNLEIQTEHAIISIWFPVADIPDQITNQSKGTAAKMNPRWTFRKRSDLSVTQVEEELKYDVFA